MKFPAFSSRFLRPIPGQFFLLLLAIAPVARSTAQPILDTRFEANAQSLPDSAKWFWSFQGAASIENGKLELTPRNNQLEALAYLSPPASALVLSEGKRIRLSFVFRVTQPIPAGDGFRIGLFDSNGSARVRTGNFYKEPFAQNYRGYSLWTNLGSGGPEATTIRRREAGPSGRLLSDSDAHSVMKKDAGPGLALGEAYEYEGWITLADRGAQGVEMRYSLAGMEPVGVVDNTAPFRRFDTLGIFFRPAGSALSIRRMTVTEEPGSRP